MADPLNAPFSGRALHFVGIGGAGMSGLALVAKELGATRHGLGPGRVGLLRAARERRASSRVIGHDAANVPEGAEVVVSTAIPEDNPELAAARAAGATVLHRGELLGELSRMKRTIAVGGTHGKTTTRLDGRARADRGGPRAGLPDRRRAARGRHERRLGRGGVGGDRGRRVGPLVSGARRATSRSSRTSSWTTTRPTRTSAELEEAFAEFAARRRVRVARAGRRAPRRRRGRRPSASSDADAADPQARRLAIRGGAGWSVELQVPGEHNVAQRPRRPGGAAGGGGPGRGGGARRSPSSPAPAGASSITAGPPPGREVYDDYAHHPTEVRATLEAARTLEPRRLVAAFQPHLYSRTRMLAREFGRALALADLVVVLDVYRARERPEDFPGVSGYLVAEAAADAPAGRPVWWLPRARRRRAQLRGELSEGDLLLTLGAGNVDELAAKAGGMSTPPGRRGRLPARPAHHRSARAATATSSPGPDSPEALAELLAWADRGGGPGRSGRVRLEPAHSG